MLCANALPTSGWRACTAVPVELCGEPSWTEFRAEVHLKSPEEWDQEVDQFLIDLLMKDRVRISWREPHRGGDATPSQVAYDTLHAVYPTAFQKQGSWPNRKAAIEELRATVNNVVKTFREKRIQRFESTDAAGVAAKMLHFVD